MSYEDKAALKAEILRAVGRDLAPTGDEGITDADLDRFIRDAETQANRLLRLRDDECVASMPVTADSEYLTLPSDFAGLTIARWTTAADVTTNLRYLSHAELSERKLEVPTGTPAYYSIVADTFWIAPVPTEAGTFGMFRKERFELVDDEDTNALLADNSDIYLKGSLVHAKRFLEYDEAEIAALQADFLSSIMELRVSEWHDKSGGQVGAEAEYF
jgi:hypothetical protein